ncbi:hypothetical protein [Candidatus Hydrogenosomobacter endosymbioticus]|uniref:Uncharacterized protein n=1 Tax=Candidatus Hydrogenosomobacter endosymbioticus TaxID=2558174 RepID=A0ABM7V9T0_9PROT|nr:hypothetical protein [Candidatus Hydrogenosomobacter endosymbioticus]BDB96266.1 hypothetical protein HYD_3990 [Candidatus Hydrogenosomobacter endosymbioticus]
MNIKLISRFFLSVAIALSCGMSAHSIKLTEQQEQAIKSGIEEISEGQHPGAYETVVNFISLVDSEKISSKLLSSLLKTHFKDENFANKVIHMLKTAIPDNISADQVQEETMYQMKEDNQALYSNPNGAEEVHEDAYLDLNQQQLACQQQPYSRKQMLAFQQLGNDVTNKSNIKEELVSKFANLKKHLINSASENTGDTHGIIDHNKEINKIASSFVSQTNEHVVGRVINRLDTLINTYQAPKRNQINARNYENAFHCVCNKFFETICGNEELIDYCNTKYKNQIQASSSRDLLKQALQEKLSELDAFDNHETEASIAAQELREENAALQEENSRLQEALQIRDLKIEELEASIQSTKNNAISEEDKN